MTDEVTPAADPSAPAAPAPAEPASPVAKTGEPQSLADSADPNAPAAPAADPAKPAADPAADPKWYLADGVPGNGDAPEWFRNDKYANLFEQARAYPELEKRFGAFVGAPTDGVYQVNVPEGVPVEFDHEHPLFQELTEWGKSNQFSQKAFDGLIDMFARYEASLVPDMGQIKQQIGENADSRLNAVNQWIKSSLGEDGYNAYRMALTKENAADVFKTFEATMRLSRQVNAPKPGDDVPGAGKNELEEINAMQLKRNEKGQRLYEIDSKYREEVEQRRMKYFAAQDKAQQQRVA